MAMPRPMLDRLRYYPTRRCWRLRYPLGKGRYESRLFGPPGSDENDKEAFAKAVLEASAWLEEREKGQQKAIHQTRVRRAQKRMMDSLHLAIKAPTSEERWRLVGESHEAEVELERLEQPQTALLERIAELELLAERAPELEQEVQNLRAIVAATGRAVVSDVAPLAELVERFIKAKSAELAAKGRQPKTMTPIRSSSREIVRWLADYEPRIETSADLESCPRALGDFRDGVVERLEEMSSGWARKQLDGPRLFCEWMVERGYLSALPRSITRRWLQVGKDEPNPTFFTASEINMLLARAPDDDLKLAILLGINCAYRESDIVSLLPNDIDLKASEIRRTRHKTGAVQCHKLWPQTTSLLAAQVERGGFEQLRYVSSRLTQFIDDTIDGNAEDGERRRTAKSLRSTAAQWVEDLTDGSAPHLVSQMLGQKDPSVRQHYRRANYSALFDVIDQMAHRLIP